MRIGDFFRIQRGIATGCNKFFVLDRSDAIDRQLPAEYTGDPGAENPATLADLGIRRLPAVAVVREGHAHVASGAQVDVKELLRCSK